MSVVGGMPVFVTGKVYARWDSANKGAAVSLAGNDLVTTQTTSAGMVRATIGKATDTWSWEITPASTINNFGIANASASLSNYVGGDANGWGLYATDGKVYNNNSAGSALLTYGNGDVITLLLDMNNKTLKAKKNGGAVITLVTGLTGTIYPAWGDSGSADSASSSFGETNPILYPESGYNIGVYA